MGSVSANEDLIERGDSQKDSQHTVMARQDWADGRVFYQVHVDLLGDTRVSARMYQWPQPGLRAVRG